MTRLYNHYNETMPRKTRVIKNSEVIKVGDFIVQEGAGVANVDAKTENVQGFCTNILDRNGTPLSSITALADADGTWALATQSYTASADNETDKLVQAEYYEIQENDQIVATLDADKGTTTGSNKEGYYLGILTSNSSLLDESDAATAATGLQFQIEKATGEDLGVREVVVRVIKRQSNL